MSDFTSGYAAGHRRVNDGTLDVGQGHVIQWYETGNPAGIPVVALHGGPGSGGGPHGAAMRSFDPDAFRVIHFDQRGCGNSHPLAIIQSSDFSGHGLDYLAGDVERLRRHLGIERWVIFGGSWGATLARAVLNRTRNIRPDPVAGVITYGMFLNTPAEQRFHRWRPYEAGEPGQPFHDRLVDLVKQHGNQQSLVWHRDFYRGLFHIYTSPDVKQKVREEVVENWSRLATANVFGDEDRSARYARTDRVDYEEEVGPAALAAWYFARGADDPAHLVSARTQYSLRHTPHFALHGARDRVCAAASTLLIQETDAALGLAPVTQGTLTYFVDRAGHASSEADMRDALEIAGDTMRDLVHEAGLEDARGPQAKHSAFRRFYTAIENHGGLVPPLCDVALVPRRPNPDSIPAAGPRNADALAGDLAPEAMDPQRLAARRLAFG